MAKSRSGRTFRFEWYKQSRIRSVGHDRENLPATCGAQTFGSNYASILAPERANDASKPHSSHGWAHVPPPVIQHEPARTTIIIALGNARLLSLDHRHDTIIARRIIYGA